MATNAGSSESVELVNTRGVAGRRRLHFNSLDELIAEAERLGAAERAATLRHLGNWTTGQALGHIATWIDYGYDGYPMTPPLVFKVIGRIIKPIVLRFQMPAGGKLPGVRGGTFAVDVVPCDEALAHLLRSVERLRSAAPRAPNLVFGKLSHKQWMALHLRHAELLLSFFIPRASPDNR